MSDPKVPKEKEPEGEPDSEEESGTNPLQGLAEKLENSKCIRKQVLSQKALLEWTAPNRVGVVSNQSLKLNADVLEVVLKVWCPVAPDRKTVPVGYLKREVGFWNKYKGFWNWNLDIKHVCKITMIAYVNGCLADQRLQGGQAPLASEHRFDSLRGACHQGFYLKADSDAWWVKKAGIFPAAKPSFISFEWATESTIKKLES